jgi:hypothetical protein
MERRAVEVRGAVDVLEARQCFADDEELKGQRHLGAAAIAQDSRERLAVHVLHDDDRPTPEDDDLERLNDVRVVEGGREPRLGEKHLSDLRVGDELGAYGLEDSELPDACDPADDCEMDERHSTLAELGDDVVFLPKIVGRHLVPACLLQPRF